MLDIRAKKMSRNALSILFSNLAKASEKQHNKDLFTAYSSLSEEYRENNNQGDLAGIHKALSDSLEQEYPLLQSEAKSIGDRGAQRALLWGKKVSTLQKSLIDRYLKKGEELIRDKNLFICEACGFIFLGTEVPELCPVCKAPSTRFSKI